MYFEIDPLVSAGLIKFGMSRKEVRQVMNCDVVEFKKTPFDEVLTDGFDGCHVFYKTSDVCEAVEFFEPAEPIFMGQKLMRVPFREVRTLFQSLDELIETDESGLTSYKFGVGIFSPDWTESHEALVEGVIVFEKGYFD